MREVPLSMVKTWLGGDFTGDKRPFARVTLQQANTKLYTYTLSAPPESELVAPPTYPAGQATGGMAVVGPAAGTPSPVPGEKNDWTASQTYASTVFGASAAPKELPNVKTVVWNRSVDNDVASATLTFWNTKPLQLGETPDRDLDHPGWYTYNRGMTDFSNRWGDTPNEWEGLLVPDNILRTYEGYGFDATKPPEADQNLIQTGVWVIDDVDYTHTGLITVQARDLGRLLLEHIAFIPVVPSDFYPLSFKRLHPPMSGFIPEHYIETEVKVDENGKPADGMISLHGGAKYSQPAAPRPPAPTSTASGGMGGAPTRVYARWGGDSNALNPGGTAYQTYKAKSGDWLTKIADNFDVPGGWQELYALNRAVVGGDPDVLAIGTSLRIPTYRQANGHHGRDAFDSVTGTYWLSDGFPDLHTHSSRTEWIEAKLPGGTVSEVWFSTVRTGYIAYVSAFADGRWVRAGGGDIYYDHGSGPDLGSGIPYVTRQDVTEEYGNKAIFPSPIKNVTKIRLTLKHLQAKVGGNDRFRAGVREISVWAPSGSTPPTPGPGDLLAPHLRGIGDTFNRKDSKSVGKTPAGDTWVGTGFEIKSNRLVSTGAGTQLVRLGYRQQLVSIKAESLPTATSKAIVWLRADQQARNGIAVEVTRSGALQVFQVVNGTRSPLGNGAMGDITGQWVMVMLEGNTLTARLSSTSEEDMDAWVALTVTDMRLGSAQQGDYCGVGTNVAGTQFDDFWSRGIVRPGIWDSFNRPDGKLLDVAETGQAWRQVGPRGVTWGVIGGHARRYGAAAGTNYAMANLTRTGGATSLDQSVDAWVRASASQLILLARARDENNGVRVTAQTATGAVTIESVVAGQVTHSFTGNIPSQVAGNGARVTVTVEGNTVTVTDASRVTVISDTDEAYSDDAFSSYVGFGSTDDIWVDQFEAKPLGASDTVVSKVLVPARVEPGAGAKPGLYEDYTDIVKLLCVWAGFYWAPDAAEVWSDGTVHPRPTPSEDVVLGHGSGIGRVWGDFQATGTAGPAPLNINIWDKKTLMDGINYVREIIGFLFVVDETGAPTWRQPNIWSVGNNIAATAQYPGRTTAMYDLDERTVLLGLTAKIGSRNVRERVFVGNLLGNKGALSAGWNPNPTGLRRVAGWTDQHFETQEECQVMADLITLRQLMTYRTNRVTISGFPGIQIDDQHRIFERTAGEGYIHYIRGINSSMDMESGQYTYQLDTNWLGEDPFTKWAFDASQLAAETKEYIDATTLGIDLSVPRPADDTLYYTQPYPGPSNQVRTTP